MRRPTPPPLFLASLSPLSMDLSMLSCWDPFTGRINVIVPFLPFTKAECAVVHHRFTLAFASNVRKPIALTIPVPRDVGHCRLSLVEEL